MQNFYEHLFHGHFWTIASVSGFFQSYCCFLLSNELIETRFFLFLKMICHGFRTRWLSWIFFFGNYTLWSSLPDVFCKKDLLRNFAKFTEKHLCQSLRARTLLKKRLWHRCFPVNFAKFLRTPFLIEHLLWLLLYFEKQTTASCCCMGAHIFQGYQMEFGGVFYLDLLTFICKYTYWISVLHYPATLYSKVKISEHETLESSRPEVVCKKGVLKYLLKFRGKHLYRSLFFNEVTR